MRSRAVTEGSMSTGEFKEFVPLHKFEAGMTVKWVSQASGFSKEKTGKIIGICPRGENAMDVIRAAGIEGDISLAASNKSSIHRYIIEVKRPKRSKFYAPSLGVLDREGTHVDG